MTIWNRIWKLTLVCLLSVLSNGSVTNCYNSLCHQHTAYYDSTSDSTILFAPSFVFNVSWDELCIQIFAQSNYTLCTADSLGRFVIQMPYQPIINCRLSRRNKSYHKLVLLDRHDQEALTYDMTYYVNYMNWGLAEVDSYVEPIYPLFGSIIAGPLSLEFLYRGTMKCMIDFKVIGLLEHSIGSDSKTLSNNEPIEPGSWFIRYSACADRANIDSLRSVSSNSYIEFVLLKEEIKQHRVLRSSIDTDTYRVNILLSDNHEATCANSEISAQKDSKIHICFWGSNVIDGQRLIWLNQILYMSHHDFRFSYIVSHAGSSLNIDIQDFLKDLSNVNVVHSPLNNGISVPEELLRAEGLPFEAGKEFFSFVSKMLQQASYDHRNAKPEWVGELYEILLQVVRPLNCHIIVYGSERDTSNDVLITDVAKILGVRSVSELLNLFPSGVAVPDVIVGPSHYAIQHSSIVRALAMTDELKQPKRVVISPAVDMAKFNSSRDDLSTILNPKCVEHCFTIGFIARLAPEKNPGLFIMTAHLLLERYSQLRFTVIGDGPLTELLIELTARLNISWAFDFRRWVTHDVLPNHLNGIDVVINTSLRAWSETFCISNIEVMSMGIPLVSFGVGGVGEYVELDEEQMELKDGQVTIGKNMILVNEATPEALSMAVELLLKNSSLRSMIAKNSVESIRKYFRIERQMREYTALYKALHNS